MKKLSFLIVTLLSSGWAFAQKNCSVPKLQVLQDKQEVNLEGSALPATITLALTDKPGCATDMAYQFTGAELTLVRDKRPLLPTMSVKQSEVDLTEFRKIYQTGDRIFIEIPGRNIAKVSTKDKQEKSPVAENQGVSANWLLKK